MNQNDALDALQRAKREIEEVEEWVMSNDLPDSHTYLNAAHTGVSSALYEIRNMEEEAEKDV